MDEKVDVIETLKQLMEKKDYAKAEQLAYAHLVPERERSWPLKVLSSIYRGTRRYDASAACCARALSIDPKDPGNLTNYGNVLVDLDRMDEAAEMCKRACDIEPNNPGYWHNYAACLREAKRFTESEQAYQKLLELSDDPEEHRYSMGLVQLYLRKLDEGWDGYGTRIRRPEFDQLRRMSSKLWIGQTDTKDKDLLVLGEQGFGDTIMMSRFLPLVAKKFKSVSLVCKKPLHRLFAHLPVTLIEEKKSVLPRPYDYHIPMMSLPPLFEKDWAKWPKPVELNVPKECVDKYYFDPARINNRLKVGIVWSGSLTFAANEKRAVKLTRFLKLMNRVPEVQFFSFQKGECEKDLILEGVGSMMMLGPPFEDFADTAGAAKQMDCILMTDSSVAHLCGSIGVPVFNLLHFLPYWLYFPEKPALPLYPCMRFIRQITPGGWDHVFDIVAELMAKLAKARAKGKLSPDEILKIADKVLK